MSYKRYRLFDTSTDEQFLLFESNSLIDIFYEAYGLYDFRIVGSGIDISFPRFCESCFFLDDEDLCFHLLVKELLTDKELNVFKLKFRGEYKNARKK